MATVSLKTLVTAISNSSSAKTWYVYDNAGNGVWTSSTSGKVAKQYKTQIGTATVSNDVYTYRATGSAAQTISDIGKNGSWKVTGTSKNDHFSFVSSDAKASTVDGGAGNDTINLDGVAAGSSIFGGAGNDVISFTTAGDAKAITINGGAGNDSILNAVGATIDAGAGNDSIVSGGTNAITLGAGDDYVQLANGDTVKSGQGKNILDMSNTASFTGKAEVTGYNYGSDVISVGSSNVATMTKDTTAQYFKSDGSVSNGYGTVALGSSSYYRVTLKDSSNTQDVWFMGENGATVSAAGSTKNLVMYGNNNDSGDFITGGSGKDTIYAGVDDSVYGGLGNDVIALGDYGAQVVGISSSGGKDTVYGFSSGSEDSSDVVYFYDGLSKGTASFTSSGLVVKSGSASLTLAGLSETATLRATDSTGEIKNINVAASGAAIQVTGDVADAYIAKNGSIDFTNASDDVEIDLGNVNKYGKKMTTFDGIVAATGTSNGSNKLVGAASKKNTLQGGAGGENSIYGGGSASDYLVGGADAEDIFYYGTGEGNDTISSFETDKDIVDVWGSATDGYIDNSGNLRIKWADGKKLTIESVADENTIIAYSTDNGKTTNGLKVGRRDTQNNFTYDESVNCYYGGKQGDTLTISTGDDAKIWLDNSHGIAYSGITTLDGSAASGAVELAGSARNEYITGGTGESSLWGGAGGNDTMTGGSGADSFYFGMGEGKDVISGADADDKVMLYNVALANIASAAVNDSGSMIIKLTDGATLTVEGASVSEFHLADGTWSYDKDANEWNQV